MRLLGFLVIFFDYSFFRSRDFPSSAVRAPKSFPLFDKRFSHRAAPPRVILHQKLPAPRLKEHFLLSPPLQEASTLPFPPQHFAWLFFCPTPAPSFRWLVFLTPCPRNGFFGGQSTGRPHFFWHTESAQPPLVALAHFFPLQIRMFYGPVGDFGCSSFFPDAFSSAPFTARISAPRFPLPHCPFLGMDNIAV